MNGHAFLDWGLTKLALRLSSGGHQMRKFVAVVIVVILLVIDGLEFHDLFEPKTLPEVLTGLISIPILVLMGLELLGRGSAPPRGSRE